MFIETHDGHLINLKNMSFIEINLNSQDELNNIIFHEQEYDIITYALPKGFESLAQFKQFIKDQS